MSTTYSSTHYDTPAAAHRALAADWLTACGTSTVAAAVAAALKHGDSAETLADELEAGDGTLEEWPSPEWYDRELLIAAFAALLAEHAAEVAS